MSKIETIRLEHGVQHQIDNLTYKLNKVIGVVNEIKTDQNEHIIRELRGKVHTPNMVEDTNKDSELEFQRTKVRSYVKDEVELAVKHERDRIFKAVAELNIPYDMVDREEVWKIVQGQDE